MTLKPVSDQDLLDIRRDLIAATTTIERVLGLGPPTATCRKGLQRLIAHFERLREPLTVEKANEILEKSGIRPTCAALDAMKEK